MTKENKLKYIIEQINSTPKEGIYKVKECIKIKKDIYTEKIGMLDQLTFEQIKKHSFVSEVLSLSERLEKESYIKRLTKKVNRLERHAYAPEMNKLHFKDGKTAIVPQQTTIEHAILHFIFKNSIYQIKRTLLNN